MKTVFSSGTIVTSQWLNGSQNLYFDGQTDIDWHYNPLGLSSLVTSGSDGLDSRYLTLGTDQPYLDSTGLLVSGQAISGSKVSTGPWNFGYDQTVVGNPTNVAAFAPRSYTGNTKYDYAGGIVTPTVPQKFGSLNEADIITKKMLEQYVDYILDSLVVDNGIYYSQTNPACNNYSAAGGSDTICPV